VSGIVHNETLSSSDGANCAPHTVWIESTRNQITVVQTVVSHLKVDSRETQSSTAPCGQPYKKPPHRCVLYFEELFATVFVVYTCNSQARPQAITGSGFEKCDQPSHLFPETKCENKTLTS